jgi:hypothetical protein
MPMTAVEELAYAVWEARARPAADDWADWFVAEALLRPGRIGVDSPPMRTGASLPPRPRRLQW